MIKVLFVITGLGCGGAEMMLYKLLSIIDKNIINPIVISLLGPSALSERFDELGLKIYYLNINQGIPDPRGFFKFLKIIKKENPDLVHTWMYHADLLGGIATMYHQDVPVIWNIRNSTLERGATKLSTLITVKACAMISWKVPEKIVCCAESSLKVHQEFGYDTSRFEIIPNGFDIDKFKPDLRSRSEIRRELGWKDETPLVGLIARYHPQKDHVTFIKAAGGVSRQIPEARFLLCGKGLDFNNKDIMNAIREEGLDQKMHLLGFREDIPRINASLDIAVSSSYSGEAFSNSLGEAMACAVPCVATAVGDAALIIGNTGRIVEPKKPRLLEDAILDMLKMGKEQREKAGFQARQRILERFSIKSVANQYESLYLNLFESRNGSVGGSLC